MKLEDIKERCYINDEGCWVWKGAISEGKWPRIWAPDHTKPGSPMKTQTGRRAVWHIKSGVAIPTGYRVYGDCECDQCLNPAHMKCGPTSEYGEHIKETGKFRGSVKRITANRATGQKRSKISPGQIAVILGSYETGKDISARMNVSRQLISRYRTGKGGLCWEPVGGMFSQLMAAT